MKIEDNMKDFWEIILVTNDGTKLHYHYLHDESELDIAYKEGLEILELAKKRQKKSYAIKADDINHFVIEKKHGVVCR